MLATILIISCLQFVCQAKWQEEFKDSLENLFGMGKMKEILATWYGGILQCVRWNLRWAVGSIMKKNEVLLANWL